MSRRTVPAVARIEDHPNLGEILGVLAQLAHISDTDLVRLAASWVDTSWVSRARADALLPTSLLVVEVLAAMDSAAALFADEIDGTASYVQVPPRTTHRALNAVRDAIAAAYARPVLRPAQHAALMRPWRSVYRTPRRVEPDLGPRAGMVKAVLGALPLLAQRCHDARGQELFETLVTSAWTCDADERMAARNAAWEVAVLTQRRRLWTLVRRVATERLGHRCTSCPRPAVDVEERDEQRVLALCADAACALLVADGMSQQELNTLTMPLASLLPVPRGATEV